MTPGKINRGIAQSALSYAESGKRSQLKGKKAGGNYPYLQPAVWQHREIAEALAGDTRKTRARVAKTNGC